MDGTLLMTWPFLKHAVAEQVRRDGVITKRITIDDILVNAKEKKLTLGSIHLEPILPSLGCAF